MTTVHPAAAIHLWQRACWVTDKRYYVAEIKQDLFGCWVLERSWGSRHSRRGRRATRMAQSYEDALILMEQVAKRRKARGYATAVHL